MKIILFLLILLEMKADFLNSKVTISRSILEISRTELISMKPSNWLTKTKSIKSGSNIIREVLYVPNLLTSFASSSFAEIEVEDDEHFISKLADRGIHVYILGLNNNKGRDTFKNPDDIVKSIEEFINKRKEKIPTRNIAIIGEELSCYSVLNYLSKALEMGTSRADIGAVVLLDPPSYSATYSMEERENILRKYSDYDFGNLNLLHDSYTDLSKFLSYLKKEEFITSDFVVDFMDETTTSSSDSETWPLSEEYLDDLALFDQEHNERKDPSLRFAREKRERKRAFYDKINGFSDPQEKKGKKTEENTDANDDDNFDDQWTAEKRRRVTDQWIGSTPKRTFEVGKSLSDRILVIDSISSLSSSSSPSVVVPMEQGLNLIQSRSQSQSQYQSPPCWGTKAAQEVADLYSAGPLVTLGGGDADADADSDGMMRLDIDGIMTMTKEEEWHKHVADVLMDWMRMLTTYNYL